MEGNEKITYAITVITLLFFIIANFTGTLLFAHDNPDTGSHIKLRNSLHPMFQSAQTTPLITTISNFTPDMIRTAYNLNNIYNAGINGSGVTIGILTELGNDSYFQYDTKISNYYNSLYTFSMHYNLLLPQLNRSIIFYIPYTSVNSNVIHFDYSRAENETILDIEWAHAIAPGAKIIVFGFFGYKNICYNSNNEGITDDNAEIYWLTEALHDIVNGYFYITPNKKILVPVPNILSFSYSDKEWSFSSNITNIDSSIKNFTDNGGIFFSASADYGAYEHNPSNSIGPQYPATDPYVISVGGSEIYSITNLYEQGWKLSGGGWSNIFDLPAWQNSTNIKPKPQYEWNVWSSQRLVPDVSANSVNLSYFDYVSDSWKIWMIGGGTSFATPIWAGIGALALEYANFIKYHNPGVYLPSNKAQFFSYFLYQHNNDLYKGFNDITVGDNYGFSCTYGWDAVTGWGSPNGLNLVRNYAYYSTGKSDSLIYGRVMLNGHILANYPVYIRYYDYNSSKYLTVKTYTDKNGFYYFDYCNFSSTFRTYVYVVFYSYTNSNAILIEKSTIYNVNFNLTTNDSVNVSIYGPSSASPNMSVSFSIGGVDSNNYKIMYTVNWGDGTITTTGYCQSGSTITLSHSWSKTGTYNIIVNATAESFKTSINSTGINISNPPSGGGSGGGGGGSCVYALTPILMGNNTYKLAEDIKVGDIVMTFNFATQEMDYGTVEYISVTHWSLMYVIDGYLMVAPDQAVWTERGYVNAENLTLNDSIYNVFTHNYMQVFSIKILYGSFTMYDFTVSVNGNFIAYFNIMKDIGGIHAC
ncbi:MAG: S8 family serine peptidase [Thermoplasmata archaeon]